VVTTSEELQASASVQRDAAFQAWFEGSKVVDEAGKSLTVYHGPWLISQSLSAPETSGSTLERSSRRMAGLVVFAMVGM